MARDSRDTPKLYALQQPEKLNNVLKEDKPEDCLSCRLLGAGAFMGLGLYSYLSGRHQLQQQQAAIIKSGSPFGMRTRHAGITTIATVLVGMGFWRLIN